MLKNAIELADRRFDEEGLCDFIKYEFELFREAQLFEGPVVNNPDAEEREFQR